MGSRIVVFRQLVFYMLFSHIYGLILKKHKRFINYFFLSIQQKKPEISKIFYLGTVVDQTCTYPPQTLIAGLRKITQRVWNRITPVYLEGLYKSMPRRMQAVIAMGGRTHEVLIQDFSLLFTRLVIK